MSNYSRMFKGDSVDPPPSSIKEVKSFLEDKNNPISHTAGLVRHYTNDN